jgi:hypothetical protein
MFENLKVFEFCVFEADSCCLSIYTSSSLTFSEGVDSLGSLSYSLTASWLLGKVVLRSDFSTGTWEQITSTPS